MATFKIGDRVRVINNADEPETNGATGTIMKPGAHFPWIVNLDYPTRYTEVAVRETEIEHLDTEQEPQDTPETEPGVWLVYGINGTSDVGVVFEQEIAALRYANTHEARAKWVPFGTEFTLY